MAQVPRQADIPDEGHSQVNPMPTQNRRNLLVIFVIFLIAFEMIAYVATTPRPREQFFQFYVLGAHHLAADYYPNNDSNIQVGQLVKWYIGVTDLIGSMQLVAVRVKLGNETISAPNDTQSQPSPAPLVTEFMRFIQDNETWAFPFVWRISNISTVDRSTRILQLEINNQTLSVRSSSARDGNNFRLIFELWTWNLDTSDFEFGWRTTTEHRVAWLQIWFNVTATHL
jgi:uncharacterized membrane protein